AAMTAVVMLFEMTLDYTVILPTAVVVAISYGVRRSILRDSIYTLKLERRGHHLPQALPTDLHFVLPASKIMESVPPEIAGNTLVSKLGAELLNREQTSVFVVKGENGSTRLLTRIALQDALRANGTALTFYEIANDNYFTISDRASIRTILAEMRVGHGS